MTLISDWLSDLQVTQKTQFLDCKVLEGLTCILLLFLLHSCSNWISVLCTHSVLVVREKHGEQAGKVLGTSLTFCHWDKIPKEINVKEERFIFVLGFSPRLALSLK